MDDLMDASARDRMLVYIEAHHVMTLACAGPWAAAVFYASEGFNLYFISSAKSRHSLAFQSDPRVAITIQENYSDWCEIKGIQLEGKVALLSGEERERAKAIYAKKFPLIGGDKVPEEIRRAFAKIEWYKAVPNAVCYIDNAAGLGQRERIEL